MVTDIHVFFGFFTHFRTFGVLFPQHITSGNICKVEFLRQTFRLCPFPRTWGAEYHDILPGLFQRGLNGLDQVGVNIIDFSYSLDTEEFFLFTVKISHRFRFIGILFQSVLDYFGVIVDPFGVFGAF